MTGSKLTSLRVKNFTAFGELDLDFSPGVNIFIGANATGKTHLLKLMYAACAIAGARESKNLFDKLISVFISFGPIAQLISHGTESASIQLSASHAQLAVNIDKEGSERGFLHAWEEKQWQSIQLSSIYIPPKEILGNAAGFLSMYKRYELEFEEMYPDLLEAAYLPFEREFPEVIPKPLLKMIEESLGGSVEVDGQFFVLRKREWSLRFVLVAEGLRKLGLLWRLIRNGSLKAGTILFWDEPEANLNPSLLGLVVEVLLELQRNGVQVFLATHNYVVLKQFDLASRKDDQVSYHSLYRDEGMDRLVCNSTDNYQSLDPNLLAGVLVELYERDVEREFHENDKLGYDSLEG